MTNPELAQLSRRVEPSDPRGTDDNDDELLTDPRTFLGAFVPQNYSFLTRQGVCKKELEGNAAIMELYEKFSKSKELPSDPVDRANVEHVLRHGYVVLENCFSKDEAEAAKAEIDRLSGNAPMKGRNPFEGHNTNRIYSLLNK